LYALSAQELCVCDTASILDMSQSAISHQLRIRKQSQLVNFRRDGKTVYYSLADSHVSTILNQGLEHVSE
ncbi:MAG: ArsR/SmtB family transcription factor, partial [Blautia sp.]